jgi:hypothetical protein
MAVRRGRAPSPSPPSFRRRAAGATAMGESAATACTRAARVRSAPTACARGCRGLKASVLSEVDRKALRGLASVAALREPPRISPRLLRQAPPAMIEEAGRARRHGLHRDASSPTIERVARRARRHGLHRDAPAPAVEAVTRWARGRDLDGDTPPPAVGPVAGRALRLGARRLEQHGERGEHGEHGPSKDWRRIPHRLTSRRASAAPTPRMRRGRKRDSRARESTTTRPARPLFDHASGPGAMSPPRSVRGDDAVA